MVVQMVVTAVVVVTYGVVPLHTIQCEITGCWPPLFSGGKYATPADVSSHTWCFSVV